ncbi:Ketosamine-3-kinase [Coniophora puteana RWD-64-598 SS2]|uniref:protein-ribulosamine 3-kinase n=1 Tax=Coniophora puteana (strain RWD-64-598) TaxID=741705 RepID=A0A5M3N6I6_CONPW|nr:Ketosamine-3-kinase [Coniophora puteana RWD-64-598 SS2]EIW87049.1 Ketosamine-3-kinase [Coniophora puteana RWD-64-598 SS2]
MPSIEQILLPHLQKLESNATFSFKGSSVVKSSSGKQYFAKVGAPREKEQYIGEAESLIAIYNAAPGLAPKLFAHGVVDGNDQPTGLDEPGRPFFLSEYKDLKYVSPAAGQKLGERLATELHRYQSDKGFGFHVPTYCGDTKQPNGWYKTWEDCYAAMIENLLSKLRSQGGYSDLCKKGEQVKTRVIPHLLHPLKIYPVLMHGDLWSGNAKADASSGEPVIFDPSSFYGHNEADLAIARIFGGFPGSFFTTYHEKLPKTEPAGQYELRSDLYELYHYLNHTVLFGGGYASSPSRKMDRLLRECP